MPDKYRITNPAGESIVVDSDHEPSIEESQGIFEKHKKAHTLPQVKKVVRERSVMFPLVLATVLAGLAGSIHAGRAAVAEVGKTIGDVPTFSVDENYVPSGKMGDIGDVKIIKQKGFVRFVYETKGQGPHEWGFKYVNGSENPQPAQFGGVMYLDPRDNWGTDPEGGYDLRKCHRVIKWDARSADGEVDVEFVIGGDKWEWDLRTHEKAKLPYPNTINRSLGTEHLTTEWQQFKTDLSKIADDRFKRVVGGFGWVIAWDSNGVRLNRDRTGAEQPRTFTIEIRDIQYAKEE